MINKKERTIELYKLGGNANPRIDKRTFRTPNLENRLIYGLLKHLASRVHFLFFGEKIICTFFAPHLSKTKMHNI